MARRPEQSTGCDVEGALADHGVQKELDTQSGDCGSERPWPRDHDGERLVETDDAESRVTRREHSGDIAGRKTMWKYDFEGDCENNHGKTV